MSRFRSAGCRYAYKRLIYCDALPLLPVILSPSNVFPGNRNQMGVLISHCTGACRRHFPGVARAVFHRLAYFPPLFSELIQARSLARSLAGPRAANQSRPLFGNGKIYAIVGTIARLFVPYYQIVSVSVNIIARCSRLISINAE